MSTLDRQSGFCLLLRCFAWIALSLLGAGRLLTSSLCVSQGLGQGRRTVLAFFVAKIVFALFTITVGVLLRMDWFQVPALVSSMFCAFLVFMLAVAKGLV